MGGIGKTELAGQYALRCWRAVYPGGICWLQARQGDLATQIINDYGRIKLKLNPDESLTEEQQVAYCWENWTFPGDVLVIFDDVTSYQAIAPFLPPSTPRFKQIVTTRLQEIAQKFEKLELPVLSEKAALELIESFCGKSRVEAELTQAQTICQEMGYLPLALELIGQYLAHKPDLTLAEMQQRLQSKGLEQKALRQPTTGATELRGLKAAFQLSWEELNQEAMKLAYFLSLFTLAPIPWTLVERCLVEADREELEDLRDDYLVRLSLLQRRNQGVYGLHELLRQYFQDKSEEIAGEESLKRQYCSGLVGVSQEIPQSPTLEQIEAVALSIPHLKEVATELQQWLKEEDLIWPFVGLGRFYEGQGFYQDAEPWYVKNAWM